MATFDEVDEVALGLFGHTNLAAEATVFRAAWEAWGIWANGGFEQVVTGALADEEAEVVVALRAVGAWRHADVFEEAFTLLDGDIDQRNAAWCSHEEVRAAARWLDGRMTALPDIKVPLSDFLDRTPSLRPDPR